MKCCDLFILLSFVVFTGELCHVSEKERSNPFDQIRKSYLCLSTPFLNEVVFQNVQTAHHLTEHQDPVSASLQFGKQLVYKYQLASGLDHGLECHIRYICPMRVPKLLCNLLFCSWTSKKNSNSDSKGLWNRRGLVFTALRISLELCRITDH